MEWASMKTTSFLSNSVSSIPLSLSFDYRIYSQSFFYKNNGAGIELAFHPISQPAIQFYAECNQETLRSIICEQLCAIEQLLMYENERQTSTLQLFYKVEPRILYEVVPEITETAKRLKKNNIELVIDIHEKLRLPSNKVNDAVHKLAEDDIRTCLGGYDWERIERSHGYMATDLYHYVRLATPPRYLNDADRFLDICFEMTERHGCRIIIDKVQSRSQYEISKKTPFFALKGYYLERPQLLYPVVGV